MTSVERIESQAVAGPDGLQMRIRWADIDALGHVNNAIVLVYLDEGRDAFFKQRDIAREGYVVARCAIDFRAEMTLADRDIWVACEVLAIGNSSLRTREVITDSSGRTLAEAEVVTVLWDPVSRGKREVTQDERERLGGEGAPGR